MKKIIFTEEMQKKVHEKLMNAFQEAFIEFEKQGGDLRDLCWNEYDHIVKTMYPNHKDRMILENQDKARKVYQVLLEERHIHQEGYGV